jgi:hypothetical protein
MQRNAILLRIIGVFAAVIIQGRIHGVAFKLSSLGITSVSAFFASIFYITTGSGFIPISALKMTTRASSVIYSLYLGIRHIVNSGNAFILKNASFFINIHIDFAFLKRPIYNSISAPIFTLAVIAFIFPIRARIYTAVALFIAVYHSVSATGPLYNMFIAIISTISARTLVLRGANITIITSFVALFMSGLNYTVSALPGRA